ncbi:MAG: hypothetical protein PHU25_13630 [Deltaproteobacteria bacterium]|nr:hypothetical protein [Deltaproteobacteria bacterium]
MMFVRALLIVLAGAVAWLAASPALAAKVSGRIVVTMEYREALAKAEEGAAEAGRDYYWNEPNGMVPVEPPRVDPSADLGVAIFQEGAEATKPTSPVAVDINSAGCNQNAIVVLPGAMVQFKNLEPFDHELYAEKIPSFKPGRQSTDSVRPLDVPGEGIYEVRCKLMPHFKAYVVVAKALHIVKLGQDGSFVVDSLAPGKYTIKVFHNGAWVQEQKFDVGDVRETQIEVKLTVAGAAEAAKPEAGEEAGAKGKAKAGGKKR